MIIQPKTVFTLHEFMKRTRFVKIRCAMQSSFSLRSHLQILYGTPVLNGPGKPTGLQRPSDDRKTANDGRTKYWRWHEQTASQYRFVLSSPLYYIYIYIHTFDTYTLDLSLKVVASRIWASLNSTIETLSNYYELNLELEIHWIYIFLVVLYPLVY